jgi:hypothetical protein
LRPKSEPTPRENEAYSYTSEIIDLRDKPSSTETADLSLPSPASDELIADQLNINSVDITGGRPTDGSQDEVVIV